MPLSGALDLNVLSIAVFLLGAAYLLWRDRDNIERHSIVFVRRTKHGIDLLDRVAALGPRAWRWWANLGVVIGFIGMVGLFGLLLRETARLFLVGTATPPVGPVVPTVSTVTNPSQAGYLGLPFWHFLIALSVVLFAHELMHGVIARVEGFDIEYVGLILLGIIPGAFVQPEGQRDFFEPDEGGEEDEQSPWGEGSPLARLRVLAAGPMANVTVAVLLGLVLLAAFTTAHGPAEVRGVYEHEGMRIVNVSDGSPAERVGLRPGMVITALGNDSTTDIREFQAATRNLSMNETLQVRTAGNGTFTATLAERPERNGTYRFSPAPVDYVLPVLERRWPGTIETYEDNNDWIAGADGDLRIGRWTWIADQYPDLRERAGERVAALEAQRETEDSGFLGIRVVPEMTTAAWARPVLGPLLLVVQVVFFVAILNLMIGIANLLPIKGLDGGWMLDTAMKEYGPAWGDKVTRWATVMTIAVIAISFAFLIGRALL